VKEYTEMLSDGPLQLIPHALGLTSSPKNPKIPNSIRYHITDIYVDELDKIIPLESAGGSFLSSLRLLIEPFVKLLEESPDKMARSKAKELLEDARLQVVGPVV
jgi:ribosomal RNA-processing protein 1